MVRATLAIPCSTTGLGSGSRVSLKSQGFRVGDDVKGLGLGDLGLGPAPW